MRFFVYTTLLFAAVSYAGTSHLNTLTIAPLASPESLSTRQIGNIQCNVARLKTVSALKKAQTAVKTLAANAT
jgi:hypothetical protein